MLLQILYIVVTSLVVWLSFRYRKSQNIKEKLWWVPIVPAYPIIGNALEFADSTKTLPAMNNYLLKYKGCCYFELLFRPLMVISDAKFSEWLLSSNTILAKSLDYQFLFNWLEGGMLISSGQEWRKARKILTPAFHFAILEEFVEVFEKPTAIFMDILRKQVDNDDVNVHPFVANFTLDNICQTAMGVDLKVQEETQNDYVDAVAAMCKTVVDRAFNPLKTSDFLYRFFPDYYREMRNVKLLHAVSNGVIQKRRQELENDKDVEHRNEDGTKKKMAFLDLLLKSRDEHGQPLSPDFIRREVDTFMFAGHDTTASALTFALYCLANHPDVQKQVLNEIKEVVGDGPKITYKQLQEMKYLESVIKETLRLYPSVPFYSRRVTEEVVYEDGKVIPEGLTLIISAYSIHRNPNVYDEPDKFIPTRFLMADSTKPFTYLPFSAGPRNCIGQKFAMLLLKFALIKLLSNFEVLPSNTHSEVVLAAESVLKAHNGVKIRLKHRT